MTRYVATNLLQDMNLAKTLQSTANAPPAPAGANGGLSSSDRSPQGNPHAANNEANSTSPSTVSRPDRETSNEHTVAAQDGSANQAVTAPTHNNSHEASTPALNSAQHTSNAGKKRKPSEEAGTLGQMSEHNIRNNLAKIVTDQRYWDERIANSKATIEKEERLLASYDAENVQLDEKRDDYRHELHRRGLTE